MPGEWYGWTIAGLWKVCNSLLEGLGLGLNIEGQKGLVQDSMGQLKLLWLLIVKR